jgi:preprotein translocase subunit YajC
MLVPPAEGQSPIMGLIPVLLMVAIFYFLLIAPVRKRQKQHETLLDNLKNGDKVVTSGGIIGTVVGIQEDRLRLKIADQVKVEVTKQSVSGLVDESS